MSFQNCMTFSLNIMKNTGANWLPFDEKKKWLFFHALEVSGHPCCLVTNVLQNIFCVCNDMRLSDDNLNFCLIYPFKVKLFIAFWMLYIYMQIIHKSFPLEAVTHFSQVYQKTKFKTQPVFCPLATMSVSE